MLIEEEESVEDAPFSELRSGSLSIPEQSLQCYTPRASYALSHIEPMILGSGAAGSCHCLRQNEAEVLCSDTSGSKSWTNGLLAWECFGSCPPRAWRVIVNRGLRKLSIFSEHRRHLQRRLNSKAPGRSKPPSRLPLQITAT